MNVALDYQPNCVVALDIDLPADRVGKEWNSVSKEFQKQARIAGYRPGKAPVALIASRYAKEIEEEVKGNLVREVISEASKAHNLKLTSVEEVTEVVIAPDKTMKIRAKIAVTPEFQLPDYANITVEIAKKTIAEEDINGMLEYLREPHAQFDTVADRPLAMNDFAVLTYEGTVEGKPLGETAPTAPVQLQGRHNAWVLMSEGTLLPGFARAIEGMEAGQQRTFTLDVPASFPLPELHGHTVTYSATLHGINTRTLPPIDDALAAKIEPGSTLESLRQKIRNRHQESADHQFEAQKKNTVIEKLLSQFDCELPERAVAVETSSILKEIVSDSKARGISDDDLKSHTDQIVENASQGARDRVRANFLLLAIAAKENITETEAEIYQAIYELSERHKVPIKKLASDLSRQGGMGRLREQIRISKALDLISSSATVVEPAATPAAQA